MDGTILHAFGFMAMTVLHLTGALHGCVTNHSIHLLIVVCAPVLMDGILIKTMHLLVLQSFMFPRRS